MFKPAINYIEPAKPYALQYAYHDYFTEIVNFIKELCHIEDIPVNAHRYLHRLVYKHIHHHFITSLSGSKSSDDDLTDIEELYLSIYYMTTELEYIYPNEHERICDMIDKFFSKLHVLFPATPPDYDPTGFEFITVKTNGGIILVECLGDSRIYAYHGIYEGTIVKIN